MLLKSDNLSVFKKAELLSISRNSYYYEAKETGCYLNDDFISDAKIANEISELWIKYPFYGYRKICASLQNLGYQIGVKKVRRIMKQMSLSAIYPKKTSITNNGDYKYPYLLKKLDIERANQVWQIDITYLKLGIGFAYLTALIDVYSRFVVSWKISNIMDTEFCISVLNLGLSKAKPDIINSDQGSQFTSKDWVSSLSNADIKISMDGKGCWVDNVYIERFWRSFKYENFFINPVDNLKELRTNAKKFIDFYNYKRPHQSLEYLTPDKYYNG